MKIAPKMRNAYSSRTFDNDCNHRHPPENPANRIASYCFLNDGSQFAFGLALPLKLKINLLSLS
jgi:hypothetical protein